jgi:hypothetical protein
LDSAGDFGLAEIGDVLLKPMVPGALPAETAEGLGHNQAVFPAVKGRRPESENLQDGIPRFILRSEV